MYKPQVFLFGRRKKCDAPTLFLIDPTRFVVVVPPPKKKYPTAPTLSSCSSPVVLTVLVSKFVLDGPLGGLLIESSSAIGL
jgi:hypothetical protein